jgi:hypothetical protein
VLFLTVVCRNGPASGGARDERLLARVRGDQDAPLVETYRLSTNEEDLMGLITGIWLALLGVLAAPSLLLSKRPDAKATLDKIVPYQGWIGAISALGGAYGLFNVVINIGWLKHWPIYWVTFLVTALVQLALGLLLGVGVLKTFIKTPAAVEKMDALIARLAPKQGKLGLAGILVGAWLVVAGFVFH